VSFPLARNPLLGAKESISSEPTSAPSWALFRRDVVGIGFGSARQVIMCQSLHHQREKEDQEKGLAAENR
jgi:hypothetical protein